MKSTYFRPIFILLIFSLSNALQAGRFPFRPTIKNLNAMTITACDQKPDTNECELVKKIYKRRMPQKAVIDIEGASYQYEAGISYAVKNAEYIYLMSRGYAKRKRINGPHKDDHYIRKGGCVIHTRDRIAQHVVPLDTKSVAVAFDYQDGYVNFGQKRDISCLKWVYDAIRNINQSAHIIIVSECLGAKVALELAARHPITNTTIVLESPFFQATDLFEMMAHNYIGWSSSASILKWGCWAFCHYDWHQDDLPDRFHCMPKDIRIFSCHRNKDPLLSDSSFQNGITQLSTHLKGGNVSYYKFDDTKERHSSSFRWPGCQQAVNAFYKKHGLPYHQKMVNTHSILSSPAATFLTSLFDGIAQTIAPFFSLQRN